MLGSTFWFGARLSLLARRRQPPRRVCMELVCEVMGALDIELSSHVGVLVR